MQKLIYNKSNLNFVGKIQDNSTLEWEIKNNVIPNQGGEPSDYGVIETDIKRPTLKKGLKGIEVIERPKSNKELESVITEELSFLDSSVTRDVEDIWEHLKAEPPTEEKREVIKRKKELRQKLKEFKIENREE